MISPNLYKGTLSTIILKLLNENGRLYGYEISRMVRDITNGELEITEGALYPLLHRLEKKGCVKVEKVTVENRERKYYTLTKVGVVSCKEKLKEVTDFRVNMYRIFGNVKEYA